MTEKSALRIARETAKLSRQQVADAIGTTVHRYWQSEMQTTSEDPELTAKAWEYLGGAVAVGGGAPQGKSTPAEREALSGPSVWVCPTCGHEEECPVPVLQMEHTIKGRRHQMKRKVAR